MKEMTLRELQLFALDILKDVHQFCTQNNIKYSLYGGTLLGAIRHKGFIPWDDDIDIVMPRDEYERFCKLYKSDKYFIANRNNDNSFQLAYSRVYDKEKTIYEAVEPCSKAPTGVWIDVFPADGCPPKEGDIESFCDKNRTLFKETEKVRWTLVTYSSLWKRVCPNKGFLSAIRSILGLMRRKMRYTISGEKSTWIKRLIESNLTYPFEDSSYWSVFTFFYKHNVYFPIETFETCELVKFEDSSFPVLCGWDVVLTKLYGNYMQYPPKEQQKPQMGPWYTFYWK